MDADLFHSFFENTLPSSLPATPIRTGRSEACNLLSVSRAEMHFRNLACDRQTVPNYSDRCHLDTCWVFPYLCSSVGVRVLVMSDMIAYSRLDPKFNFILAENKEQDRLAKEDSQLQNDSVRLYSLLHHFTVRRRQRRYLVLDTIVVTLFNR